MNDLNKKLSDLLLGVLVGLTILTIFNSPCFLKEHETTNLAIDFYSSSWNWCVDAIKR